MQTYLGALLRRDKKLFAVACLFIAGALVPQAVHFEITPFYDWKMYAFPVQPHREYDAYVLYYDGKVFNMPHTWQDYRRMMITYTLPHYAVMKQTGDTLPFYTHTSYAFLAAFRWNRRDNRLHTTPADLDQYPAWLGRYLAQQTGGPIGHFYVQRFGLRYDRHNRILAVPGEIVCAQ